MLRMIELTFNGHVYRAQLWVWRDNPQADQEGHPPKRWCLGEDWDPWSDSEPKHTWTNRDPWKCYQKAQKEVERLTLLDKENEVRQSFAKGCYFLEKFGSDPTFVDPHGADNAEA